MLANHKIVRMSVLIVFFTIPTLASADTTSAIDRLVTLLTGEFDSNRQSLEDQANNVEASVAHGRVNRTFAIVDAPAVGDTVLVGTTSYGVSPWLFDTNEFLVWTFAVEADGKRIVMSPRRFKDNERRIPFSHDARKLAGFTPDDLEAAISGASCEIVWSATDRGYSGRTKPCTVMSTTRNQMLDWVWEYELTPAALWISFTGENENGDALDGTPPGAPYRLDRVSLP